MTEREGEATVERVAVIGLGLVGGSLARDLSARGVRVSAYDADPSQLNAAMREGAVAEAIDISLDAEIEADVLILATPVDAATAFLRQIDRVGTPARLITDVGSTKSGIVRAADSLSLGSRFVGAHPIAGDHRSGWEASRRGLFRGARVYLCPGTESGRDAVDDAADFWRTLGGRPTIIDAGEHDRALAWTSHLPHVMSSALALTLARAGIQRSDLGPGGRDVTRLAGGSPRMWTAIARENAVAIEAALSEAEREIADFRAALRRADPDELEVLFRAAKRWFDE